VLVLQDEKEGKKRNVLPIESKDRKALDDIFPGAIGVGDVAASLQPVERKILEVLAQHPGGLPKNLVLLHAGYSSSGHVSKAFARLLKRSLVEQLPNGRLSIHASGRAVVGNVKPLPTGARLLQQLLEGDKLNPAERKILLYLAGLAAGQGLPARRPSLNGIHMSSSGHVSKAFCAC
jgi:hypothetical protein